MNTIFLSQNFILNNKSCKYKIRTGYIYSVTFFDDSFNLNEFYGICTKCCYSNYLLIFTIRNTLSTVNNEIIFIANAPSIISIVERKRFHKRKKPFKNKRFSFV